MRQRVSAWGRTVAEPTRAQGCFPQDSPFPGEVVVVFFAAAAKRAVRVGRIFATRGETGYSTR